jgi:hypothetical protein
MTRWRTKPLPYPSTPQRRGGRWIALCLLAICPTVLSAQQAPSAIYGPGDAVVTGFSGALPPVQIAPGADPGQTTFIDLNGPSLRVVDLRHMESPPSAQLVGAPKPLTVTAASIGQVFGVALDDEVPPNIYAAASSAYGLPITAPGPDGQLQHIQKGAPGATFMKGLWGPGGGPGSIWKINGATGDVSLFANVKQGGEANAGAALGGLAFDPDSKSLYVADRESGFIHRFDLGGDELGPFNHGIRGREAQGLLPVRWTTHQGLDVTSPTFDSAQPATWNYAVAERRIFGLAVHEHRLFYAVADSLQIWSVGLRPNGSFSDDAVIELAVPPASGPTEISAITFDEQGRMFLAERAAPTGAFDFEELAVPAIGRVLRFAVVAHTSDGRRIWQQSPAEYAIGFPMAFRNGDGGVAIGSRYDAKGDLDPASCGGFMWSTGEDLRRSANPAFETPLARSGNPDVTGLQGNGTWLAMPANAPPLESYFIEYVDRSREVAARGHMGDIAIKRSCATGQRAGLFSPLGNPPRPGAPPPSQAGPPRPPPGLSPPGLSPPPTPPNPPGTPPTPPGACSPDQLRRVRDNSCVPTCSRPNVQVGGKCCAPGELALSGSCSNSSCPSGQTAIGPSNFCCNNGQVYTGPGGAAACCAGKVVNGQCQPSLPPPPTPVCLPGSTNPRCCPTGYTATGTSCCLTSKITSSGVCCAGIEFPGGPNRSQCVPILHIPNGPQCCSSGLIPAGDGQCCPPANVTTTGVCCSAPVDPNNRANCPAQIQIIRQCAAGYSRMPDGSCCNNRFVGADGRTCGPVQRPCAPGEFRAPGGACEPIVPPECPPGQIRVSDGSCAPPRVPACPPAEIRNDNGACEPPRTPSCPPGEFRDRDGRCVGNVPPLPPPPPQRLTPRPELSPRQPPPPQFGPRGHGGSGGRITPEPHRPPPQRGRGGEFRR